MRSELDATLRTLTLGGTEATQVTLVAHTRDGRTIGFVPTSAGVVVGRSAPADVVVEDKSVSRAHARFALQADGTVTFEDLGATNGVKLNGARLAAGTLRPGDELQLGDVRIALQVLRASSSLGMASYDAMLVMISDEIIRARTFGRTFALMMVSSESATGHASLSGKLAAGMRATDRAGWYSSDVALVLLSECTRERAEALATEAAGTDEGRRVGIATYPADGTTVDELLQCARERLGGPPVSTPARGLVLGGIRMQPVWELVARIADSALPILVLGETGVGKEEIARALHEQSPRRAAARRSVNCASLPPTLLESVLFGHEKGAFTGADKLSKGLFEQADGSTLFLDEVGELSLSAQAALLRTLETRTIVRVGGAKEIPVDVRIVAATHRDLEALCAEGVFRSDLYYRLGGATVTVPPLRERRDEIAPLADMFLREACARNGRRVRGFEASALAALMQWSWPGNIRELRNVVERSVVVARAELVGLSDLPDRLHAVAPPSQPSPSSAAVAAPSQPSPTGSALAAPAPRPGAEPAASSGDVEYHERIRRETSRYELELIRDALARSNGEVKAAARLLKIPLRTLSHKLKQFGLRGAGASEKDDEDT